MSGTDLLAKYVTASSETQAQIAARFGVSQAYIALLVAGKRTVRRLDIANRIEIATGGAVPASSWLGGEQRAIRRLSGRPSRRLSKPSRQ